MCDRLVRIYAAEGIEVQALQGLDLLIAEGELTAIVGASGSGKSTLMNILAGLDAPTAGRARVAGLDLGAMTARDRLGYRRSTVGFIWQQTSRNLLPYLTALQNVTMPMRFAGLRHRPRARRAGELLEVLGVAHCAGRKPAQMSGGEQQRTAIATALANEPRVLLADEPTGRARQRHRAGRVRCAADRQLAARRDRTGGDARPGGVGPGPPHDRDPGRPHQQRDAAPRQAPTSTATPPATRSSTRVLDRAGRVQLPREMTEALGMQDRVRLQQDPDHIGVWPDRAAAPGTAPEGNGSTHHE